MVNSPPRYLVYFESVGTKDLDWMEYFHEPNRVELRRSIIESGALATPDFEININQKRTGGDIFLNYCVVGTFTIVSKP